MTVSRKKIPFSIKEDNALETDKSIKSKKTWRHLERHVLIVAELLQYKPLQTIVLQKT